VSLATPELDEVTMPDLSVPCEATWTDSADVKHQCNEAATWVVRTTCHCGHVEIELFCDEHCVIARKLRPGRSGFWHFICTGCGCHDAQERVDVEPL